MWTNRTGICRPGKGRFGFGMMTVCALVMSLLLCLTGCQPARSSQSAAEADSTGNGAGAAVQQAVLYFSATGNTEQAARALAQTLEVPLVALEPEQAYTEADLDYTDAASRVSLEHDGTLALPVYQDPGTQVQKAQIVWLGFPIWWGLAPRIVETFLDHANLQKATVVPFATSGGSGIVKAEKAMIRAYPDVRFAPGRLLNGRIDPEQLKFWVDAAGE